MPTPEAPLILGVSGLRGIVGQSLTPEVAMRFAAAFGTWLWEQHADVTVAVARDGRAGGQLIADAAILGLRSAGCDVVYLGTEMTPTVGAYLEDRPIAGAVIVTASHNPQEWNGLKLLLNDGFDGAAAPTATVSLEIVDAYADRAFGWERGMYGTFASDDSAAREHAHAVIGELVTLQREPWSDDPAWADVNAIIGPKAYRAVVDSVNASGTKGAGLLLDRLGAGSVQLHGRETGIFPHTPEPTKENLSGEGGLCDAVPGLKADIGFAQDPDADRLAIVDELGNYIGEEYTLALATESVLSAGLPAAPNERPQPVLVANLSTSRMIEDVAAAHGTRVERTPVGEANVVERMKRLKAEGHNVVLGGEGNGGVIWPKVTYVRDSLSAMGLTLSLMARTGKTVSQLVQHINSYSNGGAGYTILKRKTPLAKKEDATPTITKLAEHYKAERTDLQDGIRIDFTGEREGSWVHVRASNTEPIMRLICESPTETQATAILTEVEQVIAS